MLVSVVAEFGENAADADEEAATDTQARLLEQFNARGEMVDQHIEKLGACGVWCKLRL